MNGFPPPPGRPQNAPGLIVRPGLNAACAGTKLKLGIDGVMGGSPCGVMLSACACAACIAGAWSGEGSGIGSSGAREGEGSAGECGPLGVCGKPRG